MRALLSELSVLLQISKSLLDERKALPIGTISTYSNGSKWKKLKSGKWSRLKSSQGKIITKSKAPSKVTLARPARPALKSTDLNLDKKLSEIASTSMRSMRSGEYNKVFRSFEEALKLLGLRKIKPHTRSVQVSDKALHRTSRSGIKYDARAFRTWDGRIEISTKVDQQIRDFASTATIKESSPAVYGAGVKTLLHETLHGFSPLKKGKTGLVKMIEEITTESSARSLAKRLFKIDPPSVNSGSYLLEISSAAKAISDVTGEYNKSHEYLQRASLLFKTRETLPSSINAVISALAENISQVCGANKKSLVSSLTRRLKEAAMESVTQ